MSDPNFTGSPSYDLSIATIVIYGLLLPVVGINIVRHWAVKGAAPIPAWLFFLSFTILQIIGSAMELAQDKWAPLLLEVGLAPLLLGTIAILGESNKVYRLGLPVICNSLFQFGYQLYVYAGVAVVAVGVSDLTKSPPNPSGINFEKAGIIVLAVGLLFLTGVVVWVLSSYGRRSSNGPAHLLGAACIAIPLLYVRFVYSLIAIWSPEGSSLHTDFQLPLQGGNMAIYVVLEFLPALLVVISYLIAGVLSFNDVDNYTVYDAKGSQSSLEAPMATRPDYGVAQGSRPNYSHA